MPKQPKCPWCESTMTRTVAGNFTCTENGCPLYLVNPKQKKRFVALIRKGRMFEWLERGAWKDWYYFNCIVYAARVWWMEQKK